jgi:hypothetical protein
MLGPNLHKTWRLIAFVLLGLFCLLISVPEFFHRHYEYFDSFEGGWVSYFFSLLGGVWFLDAGLMRSYPVQHINRMANDAHDPLC